MINSKKYLSILAGVLFMLTFLMTGCVKDEAIAPLSEDELFKSMQQFDSQMDDSSKNSDKDRPYDDGDITDDEDDEDDSNRTSRN